MAINFMNNELVDLINENKNNKLENFDSFVVTNPDLVDEGIDVSGLRTTTDASILGNIPDYGGIQYEAYNPNRLSDLMRLYSGGFPMLNTDTAQIPGAVDTLVNTGDGGGMDQAIGGLDLGGNTDFEQSLLDQPMTGGVTNDNITVENIAQNQTPYDEPMDMSNPGASIENIIAQQNQTIPDDPSIDAFDINEVGDPSQNPGSINVGDQPMAPGPFDYLQEPSISTIANPEIFDSYGTSIDDPQIGDPGFTDYTPSFGTLNEVTNDPTMQETISNAFTSARQGIGDLATAGVDKIQEVGQSIANTIGGIYNGVDQTISVFGREINVPATLAGIAASQVVGAPINIAFGLAKAIGGALPTGVSSIEYDSYNDSQKGAIDEAYGPGGVMEGYNVESAFGQGALATVEDRLEERTSNGIFDSTTDKLNDLSAKLGGITVTAPVYDFDDTTTTTTTPSGNTVDVETGDITNDVGVTVGNINDEFGEGVATEQAAADVEASNAASIDRGQSLHGGPEGTTGGTTGAVGGTTSGTTGATQDNSSGFGGSCFIAGTKVTMSDGTLKNIENIVVGDKVKGHKNDNEVIKLDPTLLANRKLYSFNDNNHYFFTSEHPFMTEEGWKSIKPEKTKERDGIELYNQLKGELKIGDKLVTDKGLIKITDIKSKEINKPDMPLYNFNVSNDNSYIADGYVVHNKGGGGGGGGTHICTASYANNLITVLDFKSLKKYGIKLRRNDPYLMKAYDWFGPKLAAAVKKGKLVNFAKHSTSMWKYEQTKKDVSFKIKFMSRLHKIITRPILRALGALLTIKEKLTK